MDTDTGVVSFIARCNAFVLEGNSSKIKEFERYIETLRSGPHTCASMLCDTIASAVNGTTPLVGQVSQAALLIASQSLVVLAQRHALGSFESESGRCVQTVLSARAANNAIVSTAVAHNFDKFIAIFFTRHYLAASGAPSACTSLGDNHLGGGHADSESIGLLVGTQDLARAGLDMIAIVNVLELLPTYTSSSTSSRCGGPSWHMTALTHIEFTSVLSTVVASIAITAETFVGNLPLLASLSSCLRVWLRAVAVEDENATHIWGCYATSPALVFVIVVVIGQCLCNVNVLTSMEVEEDGDDPHLASVTLDALYDSAMDVLLAAVQLSVNAQSPQAVLERIHGICVFSSQLAMSHIATRSVSGLHVNKAISRSMYLLDGALESLDTILSSQHSLEASLVALLLQSYGSILEALMVLRSLGPASVGRTLRLASSLLSSANVIASRADVLTGEGLLLLEQMIVSGITVSSLEAVTKIDDNVDDIEDELTNYRRSMRDDFREIIERVPSMSDWLVHKVIAAVSVIGAQPSLESVFAAEAYIHALSALSKGLCTGRCSEEALIRLLSALVSQEVMCNRLIARIAVILIPEIAPYVLQLQLNRGSSLGNSEGGLVYQQCILMLLGSMFHSEVDRSSLGFHFRTKQDHIGVVSFEKMLSVMNKTALSWSVAGGDTTASIHCVDLGGLLNVFDVCGGGQSPHQLLFHRYYSPVGSLVDAHLRTVNASIGVFFALAFMGLGSENCTLTLKSYKILCGGLAQTLSNFQIFGVNTLSATALISLPFLCAAVLQSGRLSQDVMTEVVRTRLSSAIGVLSATVTGATNCQDIAMSCVRMGSSLAAENSREAVIEVIEAVLAGVAAQWDSCTQQSEDFTLCACTQRLFLEMISPFIFEIASSMSVEVTTSAPAALDFHKIVFRCMKWFVGRLRILLSAPVDLSSVYDCLGQLSSLSMSLLYSSCTGIDGQFMSPIAIAAMDLQTDLINAYRSISAPGFGVAFVQFVSNLQPLLAICGKLYSSTTSVTKLEDRQLPYAILSLSACLLECTDLINVDASGISYLTIAPFLEELLDFMRNCSLWMFLFALQDSSEKDHSPIDGVARVLMLMLGDVKIYVGGTASVLNQSICCSDGSLRQQHAKVLAAQSDPMCAPEFIAFLRASGASIATIVILSILLTRGRGMSCTLYQKFVLCFGTTFATAVINDAITKIVESINQAAEISPNVREQSYHQLAMQSKIALLESRRGHFAGFHEHARKGNWAKMNNAMKTAFKGR